MNARRSASRFIKAASIFIAVLFMLSGIAVSAESLDSAAAQNYYFWQNSNGKKAVADKAVFAVSEIIDGRFLGISSFAGITDMYAADDGRIYILDAENSRVVILKSDYSLERIIDKFILEGKEETLNSPQGIFVDTDGSLMIADTENMRLLTCDDKGTITNVVTSPQGELIPDDFKFYPIRCVCDKKGFLYILSRGSYYGALTYDENNEFCGFYGSNPVVTDAIQQIERIFNRVFTNNASAEYKVQKLPYQFADLCVGNDDILYTVSPNQASMLGQIRKLSPSGDNILFRASGNSASNADTINFGEDEMYATNLKNLVKQDFSGITVDADGYIYALDSSYGKIYVYDAECNSIAVIGGGLGLSTQKGTFVTPTSIEVANGKILVSDSTKNNITVFSLTEYGKLIYKADNYSLQGEPLEAEKYWNQVLELGGNYQLAYRGMAQAAFSRNEYSVAMDYARLADDQDIYSQAFEQISNNFVTRNLWWMILSACALVGTLIAFSIFASKRGIVLIKNKKLKTAVGSIIHPFNAFYDVKYLGLGSGLITAVIIFLFYLLTILKSLWGGFMYVIVDSENFNALLILGGTVGLVVLFAIVNWAVCSLFEGKGTLREVFCVTGFALIPQLINCAFYIIVSHLVVPTGSSIISTVSVICGLWTAAILIIGIISVHDFSFTKTVLTGVLTIIGIILVVFVLFMILTFFRNFVGFAISLFREAIAR